MSYDLKRISIRVTPEFKEKALDICEKTGWNESDFIRKSIAYVYSHEIKYKGSEYVAPKDRKQKVTCMFGSLYYLDKSRLAAIQNKYDKYGTNMSKIIRACMESFTEVLNEDK